MDIQHCAQRLLIGAALVFMPSVCVSSDLGETLDAEVSRHEATATRALGLLSRLRTQASANEGALARSEDLYGAINDVDGLATQMQMLSGQILISSWVCDPAKASKAHQLVALGKTHLIRQLGGTQELLRIKIDLSDDREVRALITEMRDWVVTAKRSIEAAK